MVEGAATDVVVICVTSSAIRDRPAFKNSFLGKLPGVFPDVAHGESTDVLHEG
jgi:hypothetical protein